MHRQDKSGVFSFCLLVISTTLFPHGSYASDTEAASVETSACESCRVGRSSASQLLKETESLQAHIAEEFETENPALGILALLGAAAPTLQRILFRLETDPRVGQWVALFKTSTRSQVTAFVNAGRAYINQAGPGLNQLKEGLEYILNGRSIPQTLDNANRVVQVVKTADGRIQITALGERFLLQHSDATDLLKAVNDINMTIFGR
jgi:hypothetical protein